MAKFYVCVLVLFCARLAVAQPLTGAKAVPGDYATIAAAVADLNAKGVGAGGVTFNVAAGHTETSDVPVILATGTASDPVIFQKAGAGANPRITPLSAGTVASSTTLGSHGDGIVVINGGDYITFDGIDLQTAGGLSGAGLYEYGYYLKKASATNACKNVTVKNCSITLSNAAIYSFGIFVSNVSGTATVTVTSTGGRSENIKIYGNTIGGAYGGIQSRGYAAASPYDLYDQNIEIGVDGGNTITSFGGGGSTAYAIYTIYANNQKIANNTVTGGTGTTSTTYGIFTSTANTANVDIYNNLIRVESAATASTVYGINNAAGGSGASNTVNLYNNTVSNVNLAASTSGAFYGVYQSASAFNSNIYGNTVSNVSKTGTGTTYCVYNASTAASGFARTYSNSVSNVSGGATVYGIYSDPVSTSNVIVYDNVVSGLSGTTVYGLTFSTGAATAVYRNKIYDLTSSGTTVYGLQSTSGASGSTYNIYNNVIGGLTAPTASAVDAVRGISITSTTTTATFNVAYNTVYLNASSSGTNFGTSGIYHTGSATATTSTLNLNNNIVVNASTPNGTGLTVAFRRSNTSIANYGAASNNNLFYAGTPSASRLIFYDGTNAAQTIPAYKAIVGSIDNSTISELPTFRNTATGGSADYLHINTSVPTQVESGGAPVAGINSDFDGDIRFGSAGYAGGGSAPDIGADEFEGRPADLTPPAVGYTPLKFTCSVGDRVLSATVSDVGGIPTTGSFIPRAYYNKRGTGTWSSVAGVLQSGDANNSTWNFTMAAADMGGLSVSDTVDYYVIAQDNIGNLSSTPGGVVATDVNTVTTHVATPNWYRIAGTLSGNYTINAASPTGGTNFQTFTDAVNVCVNGPVVFDVQPGTYNEQLIVVPIAGVSATNTVTFNGNGQTLSYTSTNTAERAVIKLNGADYITFNNLNIVAGGTTTSEYGYGVQLVNDADNNVVNNCTISLIASLTSTNYAGIVVNAATAPSATTNGDSKCDNNVFSNNTITGGYYSIVMAADGNNNMFVQNNKITGNTIKDFYLYGIYLNGTNNVLVEGNDISRPQRVSTAISTFYGIYFTEKSTNARVSKNKIHNPFDQALTSTSSAFGIYSTNSDATPGNENVVSNNWIYAFNNLGTQNAIYNLGSDNVRYYFNSILLDNAAASAAAYFTRGLYQTTAATGLEFRNNIVRITRNHAGENQCLYFNEPQTSFVSDNNVLNMATTTGTQNSVAYYNGTQYSLSTWKATGNDLESKDGDPLYVSASDLHIQQGSPAMDGGTSVSGITTDIDGQARAASRPEIGSDELPMAAGIDILPASLVSPAFSFTGCYKLETVTVAVKNNSTATIDFSVNPLTVTTTVSGAGSAVLSAVVNSGSLASGESLNVTMTTPSGTVDMSATGTYTFTLTTTVAGDVNPANNTTEVSRTRIATAVTNASASQAAYCLVGGKPTLKAETVSGHEAIQWQQSTTPGTGFANIPGGTTNPFTVPADITSTMYYRLVASCGTVSANSQEITVAVNAPQVLGTTPATVCGTGSASLSANGSAGSTLNWYTAASGGVPVGTGSSFTTPSLNATTTYYVGAAVVGSPEITARTASSNPGSATSLVTYGMDFTVTRSIVLNSVDVFASTGSAITIKLYSAGGATELRTTGSVATTPDAKNTVNLGWTIEPGTYRLFIPAMTGSFFRENTGPVYPVALNSSSEQVGQVNGFVSSLTGTVTTTASWYFMYNWSVTGSCESPRSAVTATVTPITTLAGSAGGSQVCDVQDVSNNHFTDNSCGAITKVVPSGVAPVSGSVNSCVKVDGSVQAYNGMPYVQRHYDVLPATNAATATATLTLYVLQSEFDAYNSANGSLPDLPTGPADAAGIANLRVTQFHGTGTAPGNYTGAAELINPADASIVWNGTNNWWEISFSITGFGGFYIHTTVGGALPANLLTFSGLRQGTVNNLKWVVAQELNVQAYEVERSENGRSWALAGTVAGLGNTASQRTYTFADNNVSGLRQYYRLRQVDRNGLTKMSNTIVISGGRPALLALGGLYPNPASSRVNVSVESPVKDNVTVEILDAVGRIVRHQKFSVDEGANTLPLTVTGLSKGTYLLRISASGKGDVATGRFVKE